MYDSLFDCLFDMQVEEECVIGGLSDLKKGRKKAEKHRIDLNAIPSLIVHILRFNSFLLVLCQSTSFHSLHPTNTQKRIKAH